MGTAERGGTRMEFVRYAADSYPTPGFTGETDYAVLYAGESCCLLDDIPPDWGTG